MAIWLKGLERWYLVLSGVAVGRGFEPQSDLELSFAKILINCFEFVNNQIEERYFNGSGLSQKIVLFMDCNIYRTKSIKGSGYLTYCLLPFITQSVINVINNDNKCLLWSILAALHPPKEHVSQVGSYRKYENEIKIDSFPVHINYIKQIERDNRIYNPLTEKFDNLSINVFSLEIKKSLEEIKIENCELEPLYLSKDCENAINILYYENHYMFIKNINSFFRANKTNACNLCF
jgi:hypothetical protein